MLLQQYFVIFCFSSNLQKPPSQPSSVDRKNQLPETSSASHTVGHHHSVCLSVRLPDAWAACYTVVPLESILCLNTFFNAGFNKIWLMYYNNNNNMLTAYFYSIDLWAEPLRSQGSPTSLVPAVWNPCKHNYICTQPEVKTLRIQTHTHAHTHTRLKIKQTR